MRKYRPDTKTIPSPQPTKQKFHCTPTFPHQEEFVASPGRKYTMPSSPRGVGVDVIAHGHQHDPTVRTSQTLLLDSQIRDWVVLPLLVIMICAGLLRSQVGRLLRPMPKSIPTLDGRAKSAILRVSRLKAGAGCYLSSTRWEARRLAWSARADGGGDGGGGGWLRLEADRAESEKKIQDDARRENGGDANDAITPSLVPGMDPSTMMVSSTDGVDGMGEYVRH